MKIALNTIDKLIDALENHELGYRPTPKKYSVGELLGHLVTICRADYLISTEASQEAMQKFYSEQKLKSKEELKKALWENYNFLKSITEELSEKELEQITTSYWGVQYTRYEWLLETLVHIYHHRGQLHSMIVHGMKKDLGIAMFE
ncbi:MAG: DinB family protein [Bacillaceae bacterium]|nr:DinB family protein [Bacillaceae bacterium]